jgi:putative ABC transport system substrate-binding protein
MRSRSLQLILVAVVLFSVRLAAADQGGKVYRVGIILTTSPVSEMLGSKPMHGGINIFLRELESLGYFEGRNLVLERRSAEGKPERYGEIVTELLRLNVNVIVTVDPALVSRTSDCVYISDERRTRWARRSWLGIGNTPMSSK